MPNPPEQFVSHSVAETLEWAEKFARTLKPGDVIALTGDLGAGKTVIAKGIGKALGIEDEILSPTFNYILEYSARIPFFHADLYRIHNAEHFLRLGLDEYFDKGGIFLLEWAERASELFPSDAIWISLTRGNTSDERVITISHHIL